MGIQIKGPGFPTRYQTREIVRISSTVPMKCVCVSSAPWSVITHWRKGRSERCGGDAADCEGCRQSVPLRWRGYLHVIVPPGKEAVFIELSENAVKEILFAFNHRDSLRGCMFGISKTKGGLRGRFIVEPMERVVEESTLPPEETPAATLNFLWSLKRDQ